MRLNKKKFDSKAKTLDYERQHKNAYMYWYNKVKKLQKEAADPDRLSAVEAAFKTFKAENMKRKTAVKNGKISGKKCADRLFDQQDDFIQGKLYLMAGNYEQ